ncbi:multidrug/biocide efflux PACE transporter [Salmonella enterica]|uniref:Multidrug/biocide efflux PACE transporter n=1 Tax=Salmonella enterica subsp. enterica serovar Java TaxID=224729 RepID=A0A5X5P8V5_SALEB|nr:multidrug/biocide efflux PACE transporter [Salmonella enterica]ECG2944091.1 multidrug/biocide efflux PACE transporter [Salmonella enterica subsp. enterica]ECN5587560.1 multidrug/biocide efflux PACE transporter [Salmonella enterica subsp. enterica serovar Paratyphi B]EDU8798573.1 multidrug/biocide efflux PACE transporter [Salmonella enterica subsp. enterica serovar Paratyphi A]EDW4959027.1 multidrug/biocide efflux PACE transporter [Salmonella enterica subsp. enterica serovar 4,[5],12:b:-]HBZ
MQHDAIQRRSLPERIFHAVCFEGIATAILAPTTAWLMQRSVLEMGGLTILLATTVMIWNIIYNALFDRLWPAHQVRRTAKVRALHALGFESGFIVIGVSIVAWVLNVSLLQAFTLEIGFFLFFLPYTMLYNWAYDVLRQRIVTRRQQRVSA